MSKNPVEQLLSQIRALQAEEKTRDAISRVNQTKIVARARQAIRIISILYIYIQLYNVDQTRSWSGSNRARVRQAVLKKKVGKVAGLFVSEDPISFRSIGTKGATRATRGHVDTRGITRKQGLDTRGGESREYSPVINRRTHVQRYAACETRGHGSLAPLSWEPETTRNKRSPALSLSLYLHFLTQQV